MAIGAVTAAYLFSNTQIGFITVFLLIFVLIILVYNCITYILVAISSKDTKHAKRLEMEINQLPFDVVKIKAEQLLEDTTKFTCKKASKTLSVEKCPLGPQLMAFFSKYESIETISGTITLSWSSIGVSDLNSKYTRIGQDNEFSTEFVVKGKEEPVYEIDGSEENEAEIEKSKYNTIYHWILYMGTSLNSSTKLR